MTEEPIATGFVAETSDLAKDSGKRGVKLVLRRHGQRLSFTQVFEFWNTDEVFRSFWIECLAAVPFMAFRWEVAAVTTQQLEDDFECVLLEDESLDRLANCSPFVDHFITSSTKEVFGFPNLSGDAFLIVPRPGVTQNACAHLASFSRRAQLTKQHALWEAVGEAMRQWVGAKPIWLNTAGDGVAWLHVRLDDSPKYYAHAPYRKLPSR